MTRSGHLKNISPFTECLYPIMWQLQLFIFQALNLIINLPASIMKQHCFMLEKIILLYLSCSNAQRVKSQMYKSEVLQYEKELVLDCQYLATQNLDLFDQVHKQDFSRMQSSIPKKNTIILGVLKIMKNYLNQLSQLHNNK